MQNPVVTIFLGSDSDIPCFKDAMSLAKTFGLKCNLNIASAHRSPAFLLEQVGKAEKTGTEVFIAGAGAAAHLAGVIAAHTVLPVIGVPLDTSPLKGIDSLLSTSMMPSGIPVASMAIGEAGAKNAIVLAAEILAIKYPKIKRSLFVYRKSLANAVRLKNAKLKKLK